MISIEEKISVMKQALADSKNSDFKINVGHESLRTTVFSEVIELLESKAQKSIPASVSPVLDELRGTKQKGKFSKL